MSFKLTDEQKDLIKIHVGDFNSGRAKYEDYCRKKEQEVISLFNEHKDEFAFEFEKEISVRERVDISLICTKILSKHFFDEENYSLLFDYSFGQFWLSYSYANENIDKEKLRKWNNFDNIKYNNCFRDFCLENGYVQDDGFFTSNFFKKPELKKVTKQKISNKEFWLTVYFFVTWIGLIFIFFASIYFSHNA